MKLCYKLMDKIKSISQLEMRTMHAGAAIEALLFAYMIIIKSSICLVNVYSVCKQVKSFKLLVN